MPITLKANGGKVDLTTPTIVQKADLTNYYTKDETDAAINVAISEIDLSGYALKSEIPDVSGFISEIPSEYITEEELNAKGYLTEHQGLDGYAKISDIPDVSKFQTEEQVQTIVNNAIAGITDGEAVSY